MPNGMLIRYVELEVEQKGKRKEYSILKNRRKGERSKVYGGLMTENCTQSLSRIIITDAMLSTQDWFNRRNATKNLNPKQYIRKVVHQVHDEILCVVPEQEAEETFDRMGEIMSRQPPWAPDLPLASEGGWNRCYIK